MASKINHIIFDKTGTLTKGSHLLLTIKIVMIIYIF